MAPPPEKALEEADAVFEARPFGLRNDGQRARYSFEVDRVWKGELASHVEISTPLHAASCGRTYKIGTQYVVYARRNDAGELTDMLCTRTRATSTAAEDLQVLGEGHEPIEPPAAPTGPEPTEPPRIVPTTAEPTPSGTAPAGPPPATPSSRGCAVEKPHGLAGPSALALLAIVFGGLFGVGRRRHPKAFAVAIGRRRAVGSSAHSPRPRAVDRLP